jgi:nitrous oxidase accessory protein NosD
VLVDNRSFGILVEDSRDVLIHANDISGSASGARTRGDVAGAEILANDIHDNDQMVVNDAEPHNDTGGQGVAISISSGPVTVRGNHIWGNRAESMDYGQDGSAIEILAPPMS